MDEITAFPDFSGGAFSFLKQEVGWMWEQNNVVCP